jgi:hypothetical protein
MGFRRRAPGVTFQPQPSQIALKHPVAARRRKLRIRTEYREPLDENAYAIAAAEALLAQVLPQRSPELPPPRPDPSTLQHP